MKNLLKLCAVFAVLAFSFVSCKTESEDSPTYYTVIFDSAGGTSVASQSVESGKMAVEPKSPTKPSTETTNFSFAGWYNGSSKFDFSTPIKADITLTAYWTETAVPKENSESQNPTDENPEGGDGNNQDGKDNAQESNDDSSKASDKTLETYTIAFNLNDGSENPLIKTQTVSENVLTALTTATTLEFTRSGYVFTSWNTAQDGSGITYIDGAEITVTDNITLYAQWVAGTGAKYTVKHYQQNVSDDNYTLVASDTQILTGEIGSASNASARTYEGFAARSFTQQTIAADGNTVVSIYYDRIIITLTFEKNPDSEWPDGYTEDTKIVTGKYGASVTPPELPTLYKRIANWNTSVQTVFANNERYYTMWTLLYHTAYLHKNLNGDDTVLEWQMYEYNETFKFGYGASRIEEQFSVDNYYFTYWSSNPDGSGTIYPDTFEASTAEDITLYANWAGNLWILYNANDGSENPEIKSFSQEYESGKGYKYELKTASELGFSKEGYVFGGWVESDRSSRDDDLDIDYETFLAGAYAIRSPSVVTVVVNSRKRRKIMYYALWVPEGTTTKYEVRHWLQNAENDYYHAPDEGAIESFEGKVGDMTAVEPKNFGDIYIPCNVENKTLILANSTYTNLVNVYYNLKTVTLTFEIDKAREFSSTHNLAFWDDYTTAPKTVTGRYGSTVSKESLPELCPASECKTGYSEEIPEKFTEDKTFTAHHLVSCTITSTICPFLGDSYEDTYTVWVKHGEGIEKNQLKSYDGYINFSTGTTSAIYAYEYSTHRCYEYVYYAKNIYVILKPVGGVWEDGTSEEKTIYGEYGEYMDFPKLTREGYMIKQWYCYGTAWTSSNIHFDYIPRADYAKNYFPEWEKIEE